MVDEEMSVAAVPADNSTTPTLTGAKCMLAGKKFDDMTRT